jgi:hypothetical protein
VSMSDRQVFAQAMFGDDLFERGAQRLHGTVQLVLQRVVHTFHVERSTRDLRRRESRAPLVLFAAQRCDDAVQLRHRLCANTISCLGTNPSSGILIFIVRKEATGGFVDLKPLYVRQSSMRQVVENIESANRQHALRRRATALGWRDEQIVTVDSDQGESGESASWRPGFQRLVADVGMGPAVLLPKPK